MVIDKVTKIQNIKPFQHLICLLVSRASLSESMGSDQEDTNLFTIAPMFMEKDDDHLAYCNASLNQKSKFISKTRMVSSFKLKITLCNVMLIGYLKVKHIQNVN